MCVTRGLLCALALATSASGASVRFAIIGDYGVDTSSELAVANLVATNFQPEFIVTVGDNNYLGPSNIDRAIGKYYHAYIGDYQGAYGAGALSNRFFPALGNHDWDGATGYSAHTDYFTLPGNERYYELQRGPVRFFIVNSDTHEPDGATLGSTQARWLSNRLRVATSPWRIVISQDPPYSSTSPISRMRWPFEEWGASFVVSGHAHHYERIVADGFPYIVNGAGGAGLAAFGPSDPGSLVRYNADHGAMLVMATDTTITCEFWSVANGGTLIDRFTQISGPRLDIAVQDDAIRISWPTNGADGVMLEMAATLSGPWGEVPQTPIVSGGRSVTTVPSAGSVQFFRLRR